MSQKGQVVMILLLVMVVSLAIGLSIVGHSITDISTSSRTESSARALSAAEAGIEKALISSQQSGSLSLGTSLSNNSAATAVWNNLLPVANTALNYPPFGKESFAQFWLADPSGSSIQSFYTQGNFNLYFGTPKNYTGDEDNQPSVEVHVVIKNNPGVGNVDYYSKKYYFDSYSGSNNSRVNSTFTKCNGDANGISISVNDGTKQEKFYCRVTVPPTGTYLAQNNDYPVLVRVRILYSNYSHPVALQPTGSGSGSSLPPQASIYTSTGTSGNTQRELQLFKQRLVVPYLFDYVLFSASSLQK
jgi:hypothetical protein